MIDIIKLDSCASTNTYLAQISGTLTRDTLVISKEQTAGRGQRGNSWEAAPGLNLTCSLLLFNQCDIPASSQFTISEAVSLGIVDTLRHFLGNEYPVKVKWPNDIYVYDRKICGILIEHSISNREISRSIVGIGLNVNQRKFVSDAPNPVSIFNIIHHETPIDEVIYTLIDNLYRHINNSFSETHRAYNAEMWRMERNTYMDAATGEVFHAKIADVMSDGTLCLIDDIGVERRYLFKEVSVLLPKSY